MFLKFQILYPIKWQTSHETGLLDPWSPLHFYPESSYGSTSAEETPTFILISDYLQLLQFIVSASFYIGTSGHWPCNDSL